MRKIRILNKNFVKRILLKTEIHNNCFWSKQLSTNLHQKIGELKHGYELQHTNLTYDMQATLTVCSIFSVHVYLKNRILNSATEVLLQRGGMGGFQNHNF